jgi:hypothetical protein
MSPHLRKLTEGKLIEKSLDSIQEDIWPDTSEKVTEVE